jgi:hypothetical protein
MAKNVPRKLLAMANLAPLNQARNFVTQTQLNTNFFQKSINIAEHG